MPILANRSEHRGPTRQRAESRQEPTATQLILDHAIEHGTNLSKRVFLTQPVGSGKVIDYSWGEVLDQARRVAAHLQSRGLPRGAHIAILSKNCAHFFMAELAIWLGGYATVAIYPTETAETVRYVLEHSEASLLFVGKLDIWPQQRSAVPATLPCIALPLAPNTEFDRWDAIIERTPPLRGRPKRTADEIAMLLYTSGTTGRPKGVMMSFGAITRAADGIVGELLSLVSKNTPFRILSYLPLAHMMERAWVEAASIVYGKTHIFFAESFDTFVDDVRRARPTLFLSVPRLWLKFQQGVFRKMPPAKLDRLLRIPIVSRIVARKLRHGLGLDQVVLAGSGSAPMPPELIAWYRRIGLNLIEAYGMTEDAAYSHMTRPNFSEPGWVGLPLPGVQARLSEDGEILIKSPARLTGYYKQPELTAASFTEDGFFRTGDLGERRPDGMLKITGRLKELFKTAKGKYVSPAPIENLLNAYPSIELSLVSGVGQPAPYALVVLAEELRPRLGDPAVRAEVGAELELMLDKVNRALADYERLALIVVAREPWSIEDGQLTPTLKIKRSRIEAAVAAEVDGWYASGDRVHWA